MLSEDDVVWNASPVFVKSEASIYWGINDTTPTLYADDGVEWTYIIAHARRTLTQKEKQTLLLIASAKYGLPVWEHEDV